MRPMQHNGLALALTVSSVFNAVAVLMLAMPAFLAGAAERFQRVLHAAEHTAGGIFAGIVHRAGGLAPADWRPGCCAGRGGR